MMDALFRCPVCKEYLKDPVILTGCSHNFCSECIRRTLLHKNECPVCRQSALRSHLVPNKLINQLLSAYHAQKQTSNHMDIDEHRNGVKMESKSIQCNIINPIASSKNTAKVSKSKCKQNKIESFMNASKRKSKKRKCNVLSQQDEIYEPPKNRRKLSSNIKVNCPICNKMIVQTFINSHIDQCLRASSSKPNNSPCVTANELSIKDIQNMDIDSKEQNEEEDPAVRTKENCPIKLMPFPAIHI